MSHRIATEKGAGKCSPDPSERSTVPVSAELARGERGIGPSSHALVHCDLYTSLPDSGSRVISSYGCATPRSPRNDT